ncbi:MAG: TIGR04282 family arsenosugar biosynthesis glycosyltransferase [Acidobacteria bacterium]|nr:TIGR04282 family arsenosugar biosynthesis glycosyltransferase [Acidobacteriota bacterium]
MLTKPAVEGRVKTRLVGDLSALQAAHLHAAMVEDLADGLVGGRFETVFAWALEDGESIPEDWPRPGLVGWRQRGPDLGARLFDALSRAAEQAECLCAVGSDHPGLDADRIEETFALLESGDEVVLGPALDGGYYLIGLRRSALKTELFTGITWSSPSVLEQTVGRCEELGLGVVHLAPELDVDTSEDLMELERGISLGRIRAPRVARLLEDWSREREGRLSCGS